MPSWIARSSASARNRRRSTTLSPSPLVSDITPRQRNVSALTSVCAGKRWRVSESNAACPSGLAAHLPDSALLASKSPSITCWRTASSARRDGRPALDGWFAIDISSDTSASSGSASGDR